MAPVPSAVPNTLYIFECVNKCMTISPDPTIFRKKITHKKSVNFAIIVN